MKNKEKSLKNLIIIIIFVAINVYTLSFHESWRDEAQAWILARNLSIKELFSILYTEGHPAGWFLFIKPFAKLGFPYQYVGYISLTLVAIAAIFFLLYYRMPLSVKVLVLCSPVFMYYNISIFRVYSLLLFVIIFLGYFWEKRFQAPILYGILCAILLQTHIYAIGLGIAICGDLLLGAWITKKDADKKMFLHCIGGFLCGVVSFLLLIGELKRPRGENAYMNVTFSSMLENLNINNIKQANLLFWNAIFSSDTMGKGNIVLLCIAILVLVLFVKKCYWEELIISIVSIGAYVALDVLVRPVSGTQHASAGLAIFFFCIWIIYEKTRNNDKLVFCLCGFLTIFICFFSAFKSYDAMKYDINGSYSNSELMANYIINNVNPADCIMLDSYHTVPSVYAFIVEERDKNTIVTEQGKQYVCLVWGSESREKNISNEFVNRYKNENKSSIYYLTSVPDESMEDDLIYKADLINGTEESFYLYILDEKENMY